jgi:hypothetical protein
VYGSGVVPMARRTRAVWKWAGANPAKMLLALPATFLLAFGMAIYAVTATVVPFCVALLLTITSPVLAWVAVGWIVNGRPDHVDIHDAGRVPAATQHLGGTLDIDLDLA